MSDSREFIPDPKSPGCWTRNPAFTGNKLELLKDTPAKLLRDIKDGRRIMKAGIAIRVCRMPNNKLYLMNEDGQVFYDDGIEGTDFEVTS